MDSINDILKSLKAILEDEARILSLKGIQISSVLFGLLATIVVLSTLGAIFLIFVTTALAGYLNSILDSSFMGSLIVSGMYLMTIGVVLLIMKLKKAPLFTNLFIRKFVSLFNIAEYED